jgi:RNA polymerase sigma-70 factor (ECF subfamily)
MRDTVLASGLFQEEDAPAESGPADGARMARLVSNHFDFIWRSMRRLGVAEGSAEDAAQQVFLVASKKIGPVPEERERRYLFAIALRVASAERRQRRRHPENPSDDDLEFESSEPGPEELIDRKKARLVLDGILAELPLEYRVVLVLHEVEDHTMAEIAKLLQLSPGTVASRLRRARELFDAALTRYRARSRRGRNP